MSGVCVYVCVVANILPCMGALLSRVVPLHISYLKSALN